jgi:hypothetical protein
MVQEDCRASELRSLEWPKGTFVWALWNHTLDKWEARQEEDGRVQYKGDGGDADEEGGQREPL